MKPEVVERTPYYGSMETGCKVYVYDKDGFLLPRTTFTFRNYCRNVNTGTDWIEVYGGKFGKFTIRSFRCDQVLKNRKKRRRN